MDTLIQNSYELNILEKQHNCLKTIVNMLIARNWIDNDFDKHYNSIKKNDIIEITSINYNHNKFVIKFYNNVINSIKSDREIELFIINNISFHKILIVNDYSSKAEKQIDEINNFEVFKMLEIVKDISEYHLIPKHILLSKEDGIKVMEEYDLMKKDMGRIYKDDPMAKYLYAQPDDIIQIIRCSIISGYSTYYRLVISGSIYN